MVFVRLAASMGGLMFFLGAGVMGALVPDCKTLAKRVDDSYYIDCPIISNCTSPALCDIRSVEYAENLWRHWCACDDGSPSTACNGYMRSNHGDPFEPGYDVLCFTTHLCNDPLVCDEEQLSSTFSELCNCK
jgi:hypothetical protein